VRETISYSLSLASASGTDEAAPEARNVPSTLTFPVKADSFCLHDKALGAEGVHAEC
jgi:hypothetical protein